MVRCFISIIMYSYPQMNRLYLSKIHSGHWLELFGFNSLLLAFFRIMMNQNPPHTFVISKNS
jgi:hypothetical protein